MNGAGETLARREVSGEAGGTETDLVHLRVELHQAGRPHLRCGFPSSGAGQYGEGSRVPSRMPNAE
jgi:hypothetical protein